MPRISAFARLANGNVAPGRVIEGQETNLSRTMHGLAYDAVHDEIIVPVALSGAILVFKGSAGVGIESRSQALSQFRRAVVSGFADGLSFAAHRR